MSKYKSAETQFCGQHDYSVRSITEADGILSVEVVSECERVNFRFESFSCYRRMDEGDAMRSLLALTRTAEARKVLYLVTDSEFVSSFENESEGTRKASELVHYAIVAGDHVLDVITSTPVGRWLSVSRVSLGGHLPAGRK